MVGGEIPYRTGRCGGVVVDGREVGDIPGALGKENAQRGAG